jgi:uncharacterized membrane protein YfcA
MPMTDPLVLLGIGAALGLVIGLLGGGGGILAVPLLIAAGEPFLVASSQSLVIVGAGAAAALVPHHRAKRVDWRVGLVFGALGAVGAFAGARLAAYVNPTVLMGGFTALLVAGAVTMLRAGLDEPTRAELNALGRVERGDEALPATEDGDPAGRPGLGTRGRLRVVALASSVGLVTGLLGVGAGFVVVPALVGAMKLPIKKATATALVVIVINSAVAAVVRHGSQGTLGVTVGLAVSSATFAVVGALVSRRVPAWALSVAFAVLMLLVAAYTVVHTVLTG